MPSKKDTTISIKVMPNKKNKIMDKYKACYAPIQALYRGDLTNSFSSATNALKEGASDSTVKAFVQEFYKLVQTLNEAARTHNEISSNLKNWLSLIEKINASFYGKSFSKSAKKETVSFFESIIKHNISIENDAEFVFLEIFLVFQAILLKIDLNTLAESLGFNVIQKAFLKIPGIESDYPALKKYFSSAVSTLIINYLTKDLDEADTFESAPSQEKSPPAPENSQAISEEKPTTQTNAMPFAAALPSFEQFIEPNPSSAIIVAGNILPIPSIDPFSEIEGDIQKKIRQLNRHSYSCGLFKVHPHAEKAKALEALVELVETDALKAWETWDPSSTLRMPKNPWEDFLARHPESHEHITCLAQHRNLFSRLFGWIFLQRTESLKLFQGFLDTTLGEAQTSPKLKT